MNRSSTSVPAKDAERRSVVARILSEGARPARDAMRALGVSESILPSSKTFLRAFVSRKLAGVKVGGRWLTSPGAVLDWIEASQPRRDALIPAIDRDAADKILASYGLSSDADSATSEPAGPGGGDDAGR